ncbi:MAG: hypothetical protein M1816_004045 [Peltula sp. TS41687]|nr:MAG: hypothetical protein M1816_004045 [Peltula sp. TS41687]
MVMCSQVKLDTIYPVSPEGPSAIKIWSKSLPQITLNINTRLLRRRYSLARGSNPGSDGSITSMDEASCRKPGPGMAVQIEKTHGKKLYTQWNEPKLLVKIAKNGVSAYVQDLHGSVATRALAKKFHLEDLKVYHPRPAAATRL